MARLLPLALALCGSPYCATPEPAAPAYSYAHNAHSGQVVSAVTLRRLRRLRRRLRRRTRAARAEFSREVPL